MQKAQSFQQPRDYNFMPNKNKPKQKIVIGIENNNNTKNNYSDEKAKNTRLKTEENNNRLKYNYYIRENDNINRIIKIINKIIIISHHKGHI